MIIVLQNAMSCILALRVPETPSEIAASIKSLESSLESVGVRLAVATALVVLGLFIEYFDDVKEVIVAAFRAIQFRRLSDIKSLERKVVITVLGGLFVTTGVAAELWYEHCASVLESSLQTENGKLIALLNEKASTADERSKALGLDTQALKTEADTEKANAAGALQKAGEADLRAEEEETARVELEDSIAWRRIAPNKRPSIAARLSSYGGQLAWLTYNMNDVESNDFGVDIAATLKLANWIPSEPEALLKMFEGPVSLGTNTLPRGVVVTSTPDASSESAAKALVQELTSAGFDASNGPPVAVGTSPGQAAGTDVIRAARRLAGKGPTVFVSVEPRPDGPQGDAKLRAAKKKHQTNTQIPKQ